MGFFTSTAEKAGVERVRALEADQRRRIAAEDHDRKDQAKRQRQLQEMARVRESAGKQRHS
jgi:hypothetical protein